MPLSWEDRRAKGVLVITKVQRRAKLLRVRQRSSLLKASQDAAFADQLYGIAPAGSLLGKTVFLSFVTFYDSNSDKKARTTQLAENA